MRDNTAILYQSTEGDYPRAFFLDPSLA